MGSEKPFDQKDEVQGMDEELKPGELGGTNGLAAGSSGDNDVKGGSKAGTSLSLTVPGETVEGHADKVFRESALVAKPICEVGAGNRDDDDCSEAGASRLATT